MKCNNFKILTKNLFIVIVDCELVLFLSFIAIKTNDWKNCIENVDCFDSALLVVINIDGISMSTNDIMGYAFC